MQFLDAHRLSQQTDRSSLPYTPAAHLPRPSASYPLPFHKPPLHTYYVPGISARHMVRSEGRWSNPHLTPSVECWQVLLWMYAQEPGKHVGDPDLAGEWDRQVHLSTVMLSFSLSLTSLLCKCCASYKVNLGSTSCDTLPALPSKVWSHWCYVNCGLVFIRGPHTLRPRKTGQIPWLNMQAQDHKEEPKAYTPHKVQAPWLSTNMYWASAI